MDRTKNSTIQKKAPLKEVLNNKSHKGIIMKKYIFFALLVNSVAFSAQSEDPEDFPGYRATYLEQKLDIDYLSTCPKKSDHGKFSFGDSNATLSKVASTYANGDVSIIGGLRRIHMELSTHIRSHDTLYGVCGASVDYTGMSRWNWTGGLTVQPDITRFDLARNTRYVGAIQGRFEHTKTIGLHAGIYVETGMRATAVRPLIGADYTSGSWVYQAVYPIKAGVSYTGLPHHIFSCMIRPFYAAVKVHKGFYHHPAVAKYEGSGAEVRWDLTPNPLWNFWFSVGHTLDSSLKVGNGNFHHKKDMHINQAPYLQVGFNIAL